MNKHSYYIGQGCDLTHFKIKERSEPEDLSKIEGIKIGYVGYLTALRLNINLLIELAINKPELQFILVGPEDDFFKKSQLHQLENVHFLGSKNSSELPTYIQFFDVCINPQTVNDLTIGNYPRKIDEYLAMGKPVVATQTPTMEIFKDYVYLGNTAMDYTNLIDKALLENNGDLIQQRISFAQSHSWKSNVKEIEKAIELLKTKVLI